MKVWYRSKTIWALMVSATAHLLVILGVGEGEAERHATAIVAALAPVIGLAADAVGAWARQRAYAPLAMSSDDRRIDQ